MHDLLRILRALVVSTLIFVSAVYLLLGISFFGYPRSVFVIQFLLLGAWMTGGPLLARTIRERKAAGSQHYAFEDRLQDASLHPP